MKAKSVDLAINSTVRSEISSAVHSTVLSIVLSALRSTIDSAVHLIIHVEQSQPENIKAAVEEVVEALKRPSFIQRVKLFYKGGE